MRSKIGSFDLGSLHAYIVISELYRAHLTVNVKSYCIMLYDLCHIDVFIPTPGDQCLGYGDSKADSCTFHCKKNPIHFEVSGDGIHAREDNASKHVFSISDHHS